MRRAPRSEQTRSAIIWSRARAYGRAATMASWARRSLAAETIFIALVICWVLFTDRMRFRMSRRLAMGGRGGPLQPGGPGINHRALRRPPCVP